MIYYIADLHLGHANVIKHDDRPFNSVEEMDNYLIDSWNSRVTDKDTVYIVGDFCYRSSNTPDYYLKQLKGHKILISGNHDHHLLKNKVACSYFDDIQSIKVVNDNKRNIVLCHYPLAEWNGFFRDSYHIYGHIHNNKNQAYQFMKQFDNALNAGCMLNNYMPVTFDELVINNKLFKEGD